MFGNIFKDKIVLITGNTGFKGSWLTIWMLKLGAKVYGIALDPPHALADALVLANRGCSWS